MNWIFLNKKGVDNYIDRFALGSKTSSTLLETWRYEDSRDPLVLRGIMKHKIIKRCWQDGRKFYYMDSGYFGNKSTPTNPDGWKYWHRVVPNNIQHGTVVERPSDRWEKMNLTISKRQNGSRIMLVLPDDKPCAFYGIDRDTWIQQTIDTIRTHTDRPYFIRERTASRRQRVFNNIERSLDDVWATVTFNSIAATESVLAGVPAFALAPCNAAIPVSNTDLTKIDSPWFPDQDQIYQWACHLAYGQFHISELSNGTATKILQETEEMTHV